MMALGQFLFVIGAIGVTLSLCSWRVDGNATRTLNWTLIFVASSFLLIIGSAIKL